MLIPYWEQNPIKEVFSCVEELRQRWAEEGDVVVIDGRSIVVSANEPQNDGLVSICLCIFALLLRLSNVGVNNAFPVLCNLSSGLMLRCCYV